MSYLNRTNYKYQLRNPRIRHKKPLIFCVLFLALFSFVVWSNTNKAALKEKIFSEFNDFFHKIFEITLKVDTTIANILSIGDYINLHEKNKKLAEENTNLKAALNNLSYISEENQTLKQLSKFVSGKGTLILSGNIAVRNPNAYSKEIRILAGQKHGIKEGQIVLDKHGLLGRVINVGQDVSTVLLITDTASRVPVIFPRIDNKGIISGTYDSNLEISLLEKNNLPEPNDVVVTSGDGGFFPPGLIIGNVRSIGSNGEVKVKPSFDISQLNFVSVIEY